MTGVLFSSQYSPYVSFPRWYVVVCTDVFIVWSSCRTRLGERMVSMSSTLVETVSINYEDFNESFLTCGTCLCE
jgi:hypothetical protein